MRMRYILVLFAVATFALSGCDRMRGFDYHRGAQLTGGNPHDGKTAINRYGCKVCHTIPGIEDAHGVVGPSLEKFGQRDLIGKKLPNTPDNLEKWLKNPRAFDSHTMMPALGLTAQETKDVAAYLYSLQ
jgi:cytochrome c